MAKDAKFMVAIHVQLRGDLLLIHLGSTRTATNGRAEFFSAQADTVKKVSLAGFLFDCINPYFRQKEFVLKGFDVRSFTAPS